MTCIRLDATVVTAQTCAWHRFLGHQSVC